MCDALYPWGGRFKEGDPKKCVAIVTLSEELDFDLSSLALYGNMKTENLGVEKVVANVVSNPNIRHVIVAGNEVRGHRSGESIIKLHKNGIDGNNRVIGANSAVPFIENLPREAIERFQAQVEIVDMMGVDDVAAIEARAEKCEDPGPFGEPMIVEMIEREGVHIVGESDLALHSGIEIDSYGVITEPAFAGDTDGASG